jgi:hypothetical protein
VAEDAARRVVLVSPSEQLRFSIVVLPVLEKQEPPGAPVVAAGAARA